MVGCVISFFAGMIVCVLLLAFFGNGDDEGGAET